MSTDATPVVVLLIGDDEVVRRDTVRRTVDELVGGGDAALMVDEVIVGAAVDDGPDPLMSVVQAAETPPLLTPTRVVLARVGERRTTAASVAPLVAYLGDPLGSTTLVLDWDAGRPPKSLLDAVSGAGGRVVDTSPPARRAGEWIGSALAAGGVHVDGPARARIEDWLGDDRGRLIGLVELLAATYGSGARLGLDQIEPFLGDDGGVPPWELTDAIERGDTAAAVNLLHRLLAGGDRHPFAVLSTLAGHYLRILRLDGAPVTGERDAAALLGLKGSTFPARKALASARRLGHDGCVRAVTLLAAADLDLRGARAWPDELVLEVLVARLAALHSRR